MPSTTHLDFYFCLNFFLFCRLLFCFVVCFFILFVFLFCLFGFLFCRLLFDFVCMFFCLFSRAVAMEWIEEAKKAKAATSKEGEEDSKKYKQKPY
tara:strand:- start:399 stop:683 length:285 start_codon:yes stop_codon:yes gene_type:complete